MFAIARLSVAHLELRGVLRGLHQTAAHLLQLALRYVLGLALGVGVGVGVGLDLANP